MGKIQLKGNKVSDSLRSSKDFLKAINNEEKYIDSNYPKEEDSNQKYLKSISKMKNSKDIKKSTKQNSDILKSLERNNEK